MSKSLEDRYASSPLSGGNAPLVEHMYEQFLGNPESVEDEFRSYFEQIADGSRETPRGAIEEELKISARRPAGVAIAAPMSLLQKEMGVAEKMLTTCRSLQV